MALEQQVQKLQAELQAAKTRPASTSGTASAAHVGLSPQSSAKLAKEIARVERMLADVMKLIDDPASALSTVMRKNMEKTELESYLRGIRFATAMDNRST